MINEQIRDKEVRVIGEEGQQLGIMSSRDAMKLAKDAGLDTLRFRGREMAHMGASKHILDDFAENLKDIASVEKPPKLEGKSMSLVLAKNIK